MALCLSCWRISAENHLYFESQNVYSELGTTVKSMLEVNVKCLKYVETNLVLSWYFQKFDSIGSFSKDEH